MKIYIEHFSDLLDFFVKHCLEALAPLAAITPIECPLNELQAN